ncbi:hypothetical protein [Micromonospora sp. NPDC049891]|uniref:hypothetical protein n=1 Tax=Micromonospora sp. NPDC049891 TaxID=3155655 RepID=UPI0033E5A310
MSFWNWFTKRRSRKIEQQRTEAVARAMARGATPEQAVAAGERAAHGITRTTMSGTINT